MTKRRANRDIRVRFTEAEDKAIYEHMATKPKGMKVSERYTSCLDLQDVHPSRTKYSIQYRWSLLSRADPPVYNYRGLKKDPATVELPSKESPKSMTIKVKGVEITVLFTNK